MTVYKRGAVLLVSFPYSEDTRSKDRPALVVSTEPYNRGGPDIVIAHITTNLAVNPRVGDRRLRRWKDAGLRMPSLVRARLTSIHPTRVVRALGKMPPDEMARIDDGLRAALGLGSTTRHV